MTLLDEPALAEAPVIDGYKVLDPCVLYAKLGEGGMGSVFRGRHLNLDVEVAIKCLKTALATDQDFVVRFRREAKVAASVRGENLVGVFDVREIHAIHYIIMEYVAGETATQRCQRKETLSIEEALTIVAAAARGLSVAHGRGVLHRDIKPDNILISTRGEVKLADLGLAKAAQAVDSLATGSGIVMGTPSYMPPEQFEGVGDLSPAADVYALGATLYFLLTGQHAIEPGPIARVARRVCDEPFPDIAALRTVPEPVAELIRQSTAKDVGVRHADANEFLSAIEPLVPAEVRGAMLATAESNLTGTNSMATVSPPPRRTLLYIRKQIASDVDADPDLNETKPSLMQPPSGTQTVTHVVPRRRRPWLLVAALAIIAVVGAWLGGLFDSDPNTNRDEVSGDNDVLPAVDLASALERALVVDAPTAGLVTNAQSLAVRGRLTAHVDAEIVVAGQAAKRQGAAFSAAVADLAEGPHDVAVVATLRETSVTKQLSVVIDRTPPTIAITTPLAQARVPAKVRVEGTVLDAHPPGEVEVNGSKATVSEGRWSVDLELERGAQEIVVTARDGARNQHSERLELVVLAEPQSFTGLTLIGRNQHGALEYRVDRTADKDGGGAVVLVMIPGARFRGVELSPYFVSKFEITQHQYERFCAATGKAFRPGPPELRDHPINNVGWEDASAFCRWAGLVLPTELQWEFAARGAASSAAVYPWGDDPPRSRDGFRMNANGSADGHAFTAPVGSFALGIGPFGIYDQAGNVWEWCQDWYDEDATSPTRAGDGLRQVTGAAYRAYRGGGHVNDPTDCSVASRDSALPNFRWGALGFRAARLAN